MYAGRKLMRTQYTLPVFTNPDPTVLDNINCTGQTIEVPRGQYHSFNFLGATDGIAYVNGEFFAVRGVSS